MCGLSSYITINPPKKDLFKFGPEVEYEADGRVWVFYRDQKIEITDLFEDGICHVKLCGENGVSVKAAIVGKAAL